MKKILATAVVAFCVGLASFVGPSVQAAHAQSSAWLCRAQSNYAWGLGQSSYQSEARNMALMQCAVRTPATDTCVIQWCRVVYGS